MTEPSSSTDLSRLPSAGRRVLVIVLLIAGLALLASSADLHAWLMSVLPTAEAIIRRRPILGGSIFVLFAAASAILAFVSSAVIVPVGIHTWGAAVSVVLLWIGWILGGVCAYAIGWHLGRPVVKALTSEATLVRYEHRISHRAPFRLVLLFQIALPSEVPGYLLGLVRYDFWKYLAALALAELPYAVATVYLGTGFIERRTSLLVGVGSAVAAFSGWALYTLHRRISEKRL